MLPQSDGLAVLTIAGTSPNYRGLYDAVRQAHPFEEALLDELHVQYRETEDVTRMAEAMVAIEHTHDHLKKIAAAGWRTPAEHPDLDPAHEALLIREQFTEVLRTDHLQQKPEAFKELMSDSEEAAQELEDALRQWQSTTPNGEPPDPVFRLSSRITTNCKTCHQRFRDIPLSEK